MLHALFHHFFSSRLFTLCDVIVKLGIRIEAVAAFTQMEQLLIHHDKKMPVIQQLLFHHGKTMPVIQQLLIHQGNKMRVIQQLLIHQSIKMSSIQQLLIH